MSELEVGQVWKRGGSTITREVIKLWCGDKGEHIVGYFKVENHYPSCLRSSLITDFVHDNNTLMTNADGTPVKKPKKYKELTPVEAMRLLADAGEPVECEVRDKPVSWRSTSLCGVAFDDNYPFITDSGESWECCRIEVSND